MFTFVIGSLLVVKIFLLLSIIKPPHFVSFPLKADTFFHHPRKSIENFSFIRPEKCPVCEISTRDDGMRRMTGKEDEEQYFAFISHIRALLCSRYRQRTSNILINNCIKQHRVYAYLSFVWNNHRQTEGKPFKSLQSSCDHHEPSRFSWSHVHPPRTVPFNVF